MQCKYTVYFLFFKFFLFFLKKKFWPWAVSFCVSRLEGRSVRSTERSEARKGAAPLGATP